MNERRKRALCRRVMTACGGAVAGKRIALLGVAFKPDTDDMRDAPSIQLVRRLADEGAILVAYDPAARENAALLPAFRNVHWAETALKAVAGADAAVIMTEWSEFRRLDLGLLRDLMRQPTIVDFRNVFEPADVEAAGIDYWPVGRPAARTAQGRESRRHALSSGDRAMA